MKIKREVFEQVKHTESWREKYTAEGGGVQFESLKSSEKHKREKLTGEGPNGPSLNQNSSMSYNPHPLSLFY